MKEYNYKEDGYDILKFEILKLDEYSMELRAYEYTAWDVDYKNPHDEESLFQIMIKWDGCSHLWLKDNDDDNYAHLCGFNCYERFSTAIKLVMEIASKEVESFDKEVADYNGFDYKGELYVKEA